MARLWTIALQLSLIFSLPFSFFLLRQFIAQRSLPCFFPLIRRVNSIDLETRNRSKLSSHRQISRYKFNWKVTLKLSKWRFSLVCSNFQFLFAQLFKTWKSFCQYRWIFLLRQKHVYARSGAEKWSKHISFRSQFFNFTRSLEIGNRYIVDNSVWFGVIDVITGKIQYRSDKRAKARKTTFSKYIRSRNACHFHFT